MGVVRGCGCDESTSCSKPQYFSSFALFCTCLLVWRSRPLELSQLFKEMKVSFLASLKEHLLIFVNGLAPAKISNVMQGNQKELVDPVHFQLSLKETHVF